MNTAPVENSGQFSQNGSSGQMFQNTESFMMSRDISRCYVVTSLYSNQLDNI